MDHTQSLDVNLNEFKKLTIELANIDENISNESQFVIISNSLPNLDIDVKTTIKYGR